MSFTSRRSFIFYFWSESNEISMLEHGGVDDEGISG